MRSPGTRTSRPRPRRWSTSPGIDPATRPRSLSVVARLRKRVEGGDENDPAVLGTIATEMVMAGEPADVAAEMAERALDGFDCVGAWAPTGRATSSCACWR